MTADRDTPANHFRDLGHQSNGHDHMIEVGLISDAIVKGHGDVDLLEMGRTSRDTSESYAVAKVSGNTNGRER